MDIYLLNAAYNRFNVLDEFESFIWTERYSAFGDFKLTLTPTTRNRELLLPAKFIGHSETDIVMVVDEVLDALNEDGVKVLTVTGRSMSALLETRAVTFFNVGGGLSTSITDTVGQVISKMVSKVCVYGQGLATADVIPDLYTSDTTGTTEVVTVALKTQDLYTAVKEICDGDQLGFRIQLRKDTPRLRFNIYKGIDRPNVYFSAMLDNLASESHLKSETNYRNIAYVVAKDNLTIEIVASPGVSVNVTGLKRRVLVVDGKDIDNANITWDEFRNLLKQRGREALAQHKRVSIFDGEISQDNKYVFKKDYALGDSVYLIDEYNVKTQVYVSEYIWAHDAQGLKSFPSFTSIAE